jgi:hypothetical protein
MVSYDNTTTSKIGLSTVNDDTYISTELNLKNNNNASFNADIDKTNVSLDLSYSDTTETHATFNAQSMSNGNYASVGIDAYVVSGNQADAHLYIGNKGFDGSGYVSSGSSVGIDTTSTVNINGSSITTGTGVSIGDQFSVGGGIETTIDNGIVTLGVEGDIASYIGLECDVSLSVDVNELSKNIHHVGNEIINTSSKINKKNVSNGVKKTGKKINKIKKL